MIRTHTKSLLALDVGSRRIGVALADNEVRFAHPLTTIAHTDDVFAEIASLIEEYGVMTVIAGLPRGLEGQETAQTQVVEVFARELKQHIHIPIVWQDEALTSAKAEAELSARSKRKSHSKGDVDALAATYILEDYIAEHPKGDV